MTPMGEMKSFDSIREAVWQRRAERLELENTHLRNALEDVQKVFAAAKAILAELEIDAKQAREDEAWAKANKAVIDSEPVDKCWCAMVVREDGPLIDVPSANGRTIAEALRALREKVEGGAP